MTHRPNADAPSSESRRWRFSRREFAGSLADLGVMLPIATGLILINGMHATAIFVTVGLYYVLAGLYFRTVVPVQPMKVIGGYAIARGLSPLQVSVSGLWVGAILLLLSATGAMRAVGRYIPRPAIRGLQLTTGVMLLTEGVRFMLGQTALQTAHGAAEPFLSVSRLGPIPLGLVLGVAAVLWILFMGENRSAPAVLVVLAAGASVSLAGGAAGRLADFHLGLHWPEVLPYGLPTMAEALAALFVLALPQTPMTVGNAMIAQADLAREYFGEEAARRSSYRGLAVSMGLANLTCAAVGAMPLCHGAGGLAAHYRFGARTAGANLMIGPLFLAVGLLCGDRAVDLLGLSVLGALLVFAGAELSLMIQDLKGRAELLVALATLGVALATNLAAGFVVGILLAYAFQRAGREI
jgi:SulP family sulfate permease